MRNNTWLVAAGFTWFAALLVSTAWVNDDAFIGYRSMEQLEAGNGPVWNAHQRVQIYTSVAWFWLGYLVRQVTDDYFLLMLSMSAACSAAMLALLRRWLANDAAWLVLVLALSASRGLVDFVTSGLEFPLVCLLAVAIMILWRKVAASPTPANLARLLMLASIVPLVRHDMVLLVAPACLHAMWVGRRCLSPGRWFLLLCATALPLVCWTAFSLTYYGFPLPNTFYARAAAEIPRLDLLVVGVYYYATALVLDPVVLPFIAAGVVLMWRRGMAPLAAGVLLHMLYVLWVGGDYMFTRFLVPDLVVACTGAAAVLRAKDLRASNARLLVAGLVLVLVSLGALLFLYLSPDVGPVEFEHYHSLPLLVTLAFLFLLARMCLARLGRGRAASGLPLAAAFLLVWQVADPYSPARGDDKTYKIDSQIWRESASVKVWLDDRAGLLAFGDDSQIGHYLDMTAMAGLPVPPVVGYPFGLHSLTGQAARMFDASSSTSIGQHGLWAGTETRVVDRIALADPYLARTRYHGPAFTWAIAHWHRGLPIDYARTIVPSGAEAPQRETSTLAGDIALATTGVPLLGRDRLAAIHRLNSGHHDMIEPTETIIDAHSGETFYFHGPSGVWLPFMRWGRSVPVRIDGPQL